MNDTESLIARLQATVDKFEGYAQEAEAAGNTDLAQGYRDGNITPLARIEVLRATLDADPPPTVEQRLAAKELARREVADLGKTVAELSAEALERVRAGEITVAEANTPDE